MSKKRYIFLHGMKITVSAAVYRAFKRLARKERKRRKAHAECELSLEASVDNGFDAPSCGPLVDEIVANRLLMDTLISTLDRLTLDERGLIDALFFEEKSERELAAETGRSKMSVHKQKKRVLGKLRKLLSQG